MDGNGRWARRRGLPRTAGHTAGEESLAEVVRQASKRDIGWLTVFGFSTENWIRPRSEVRHILALHRKLFGRIDELNDNNVRVNWIGRPFDEPGARTPIYIQRAIRRAIDDTAHNTGMVLTVAFDYGSRAEITRAAQSHKGCHLTITAHRRIHSATFVRSFPATGGSIDSYIRRNSNLEFLMADCCAHISSPSGPSQILTQVSLILRLPC